MTEDEIIAYALAHLYATVETDDEHAVHELLIERANRIGIEVPAGDEIQRAVLHRFDPLRVPDYPLLDVRAKGDAEEDDAVRARMGGFPPV